MDDLDQDPISNALRSRRIPHARARNNARGAKGSGRTMFDPLRAVGVYDMSCGAIGKDRQGGEATGSTPSSLTIHGLTPEETGMFVTLDIGGIISGMAVLAGSKKGVESIVEELEEEDGDEDDVSNESNNEEDNADGSSDDDEDEEGNPNSKSVLEIEDDKINRRARAFEKNSFRNPKFWMRWKAHVKPSKDQEVSECNLAYIVFSGNDCATFEGTITSEVLAWDNVRIKGRKVKSHAGECPSRWSDFD